MPEISICWLPVVMVIGAVIGMFLIALLRMSKACDPAAPYGRGVENE